MTRESAIHDRDVCSLRDETRLLLSFHVNFEKGKQKRKLKWKIDQVQRNFATRYANILSKQERDDILCILVEISTS